MGVGVWAATWVSQELSVTHGEEPWEGPDRKEEFSLGVSTRGQQLATPLLGQMAWALLGPTDPGLAYHVPSCPGPLSYPSALLP